MCSSQPAPNDSIIFLLHLPNVFFFLFLSFPIPQVGISNVSLSRLLISLPSKIHVLCITVLRPCSHPSYVCIKYFGVLKLKIFHFALSRYIQMYTVRLALYYAPVCTCTTRLFSRHPHIFIFQNKGIFLISQFSSHSHFSSRKFFMAMLTMHALSNQIRITPSESYSQAMNYLPSIPKNFGRNKNEDDIFSFHRSPLHTVTWPQSSVPNHVNVRNMVKLQYGNIWTFCSILKAWWLVIIEKDSTTI